MKRLLVIIAIILFSCNSAPKNYNTENIIPPDKMKKILYDFYLADAAIMSQMQEGTYARDYSQYYYQNLFKKHQTNREEFLNSLRYYCFDIKSFSEIINATILELNKSQQNIQSK